MNMFLQKNFPYDSTTAFAPISLVAESLLILAVNATLPVKSLQELIAYAKSNPGKLSYGSAGVGTGHHIGGELLKKHAGIDMVHVPYRGTAPLLQDLVSNAVQVGFGTPTALVPFANSGALRIIALAEAKRSPDFPGIPTINEIVPGVVTNTWVGFFAPPGTPDEIVERLNQAMKSALRDKDVIAKLNAQGWIAKGSTPAELAQLIKTERAYWAQVIPEIGLRPE